MIQHDAALERAQAVADGLAQMTTEDAYEQMVAAEVPAAPVLTHQDVLVDPQILHYDCVTEAEYPVYGRCRRVRPSAPFSETVEPTTRPSALYAEHSEEILRRERRAKRELPTGRGEAIALLVFLNQQREGFLKLAAAADVEDDPDKRVSSDGSFRVLFREFDKPAGEFASLTVIFKFIDKSFVLLFGRVRLRRWFLISANCCLIKQQNGDGGQDSYQHENLLKPSLETTNTWFPIQP